MRPMPPTGKLIGGSTLLSRAECPDDANREQSNKSSLTGYNKISQERLSGRAIRYLNSLAEVF
jgi:hypothetical protein